ncbi:hypothetical protein KSS87_011094 [Heliosperma pusillum]|nr:hypothetical protein KSS87_011094 [Heliosperma pusillum]
MNSNKDKAPNSLSSQQRVLLFQSISQFFEINGFSKTLKKFRKEANIQKDDGESCTLNIEEMCYEYLKSRSQPKDDAVQEQGINQKSGAKTKEKGDNEGKKSEPTTENGVVDGVNLKSKKSKKSKSAKDASDQIIEEAQPKITENPEETHLSLPSEPKKKSKDKKKKRIDESEPVIEDVPKKQSEVEATDGEKKEKKEKKAKKIKKEKNESNREENAVEADEETKETNKRKRPSCNDSADHAKEATVNGSKLRKIDDSDKSNGLVQTPNGFTNGVVKKEEKEMSQKTKELDGSAEPASILLFTFNLSDFTGSVKYVVVNDGPKTAAKAFQRVKPEDVEFADERLQDNSYWAKDGADSGYGAKAQEVLGQVRGRDFRHEKTKKKRGSYRGGQIDLHTHSVKFNYGDDDE